MNIYMAAVFTNNYMRGQKLYEDLNGYEKSITDGLPHILESYHYVKGQRYVDDMRRWGAKVFLDSGAFSAFTLEQKHGKPLGLNVPGYVKYIQENIDIIRNEDGVLMASVLDGIGDPQETLRNQDWMEYLGVRPLPCFHANEDERYLEYYVRKYEYITLGGMVGATTGQLIKWLDHIWEKYLIDGSGRPKLKVHGFGITAIPIMERYPWFSCDSSSWLQTAAFGSIQEPEMGPISVSEKSPSRHTAMQHLTTLSAIEVDYLLARLEKQQFTYERLSKVYQSRVAYNLWAYGVINTMMVARGAKTFTRGQQDLLDYAS